MASESRAWFAVFAVPVATALVAAVVWMEIAKARSKPDWWGFLMIVPLANLVVSGYLAFSD